MIRTSLQERNARGRAAETAARPPTRTKSSISVVTNKTLKKYPRTNPDYDLCGKRLMHVEAYARKGPILSHVPQCACREVVPRERFPAVHAQFRVTPRARKPKSRRAKTNF